MPSEVGREYFYSLEFLLARGRFGWDCFVGPWLLEAIADEENQ